MTTQAMWLQDWALLLSEAIYHSLTDQDTKTILSSMRANSLLLILPHCAVQTRDVAPETTLNSLSLQIPTQEIHSLHIRHTIRRNLPEGVVFKTSAAINTLDVCGNTFLTLETGVLDHQFRLHPHLSMKPLEMGSDPSSPDSFGSKHESVDKGLTVSSYPSALMAITRLTPIGFASGLWLLWDPAIVRMTIHPSTFQDIHVTMELVYGDFNEVLSPDEKWAGNVASASRIRDFKNSVDQCSLVDLGYTGQKYTCHEFSSPQNKVGPHLSAPLHCPSPKLHLPQTFPCEWVWLSHPSFANPVRHAWSEASSIPTGLQLIRDRAKLWNKISFDNIFERKNRFRVIDLLNTKKSSSKRKNFRPPRPTLIGFTSVIPIPPSFTTLSSTEEETTALQLLKTQADKKSINSISHTLDFFLAYLGLTINKSKSVVWFSPNSNGDSINATLAKLQIPRARNLGSYLGFYMQCIPFPVKVCNQLDKMQRDFFWFNYAGKRKVHTMCWDRICKPKSHGGLGIYKTRERNLSYLAKLAWQASRSSNQHLPWAKLLHHYLGNHIRAPSLLGKDLIRGRNLLSDSLISIIYSGKDTNFWLDCWTSLGPLRNFLYGPLHANDLNLTVQDLALDFGSWNWDHIPFDIPHPIKNKINAIPVLKNSSCSDLKVWRFNLNGQLDLKSAYNFALNLLPQQGASSSTNSINWVWKSLCHTRLQYFLWSCASEALPCRALLCKRGINVPPQCPLCGHPNENISHLLMDCPITNLIWVKLNICPASTSFSSWLKSNVTNETSSALNIPTGTIFIYCLWHIWLGRNQCVFNNQTFTPQVILKRSLAAAAEYFHLNLLPRPLQCSDSILLKWQPPPHNWWKLNTNGACSGNPGPFAIGGLIRNHNGTFISGFSSFIGYDTAFTAELWAITVGLNMALSLNCNYICVESDSLLAVNLLNSSDVPDTHHLYNLIMACRSSLQGYTEFKILHSYREGNGCADSLAKQALLSQSLMATFESILSHIRLSFLADLHRVHYARNVSSTSAH
ncbi:reverse transcriptase [Senna tora]|uniref:Reverse transcriptase n=1 Tax=Senna tora TaxID=362788 RepID=A0A835CKK8_9FABA|nr:reverse transcriptase [Senna tora]